MNGKSPVRKHITCLPMIVAGTLAISTSSAYSSTQNIDWILNSSWVSYQQPVTLNNQTRQISVSGHQTSVGLSLTNWTLLWSPGATSGEKKWVNDTRVITSRYQTDSNAFSVTYHGLPWYLQLGYALSDSDLTVRLSDQLPLQRRQQQASDWSIETGKGGTINDWGWSFYTALVRSVQQINQQQWLESGHIRQDEDITEHYAGSGLSATYFWPNSNWITGTGMDYQRRLSSDGDNTSESLLRPRGRSVRTSSTVSSGALNWSALYLTVEYEFSVAGVSLYYQYELNEPSQDRTGVSLYFLL